MNLVVSSLVITVNGVDLYTCTDLGCLETSFLMRGDLEAMSPELKKISKKKKLKNVTPWTTSNWWIGSCYL